MKLKVKNEKTDKLFSNINGVTCDSRKVKQGYAFVAIKGIEDDGHKYIEQAINNGASIIFTEKPFQSDRVNIIQVDDSRKFLGELAARFYDYPSKKINVIGVTGTNGKTTTTHLIYNLLNYENKKAGLIGTVRVDTGQKIKSGDLTTPAPVLLQNYLKKMVNNNLKYACMEISSHGIKLKRITDTYFDVKVGTNITADHFDLHSNFKDYLEVKKSFLEEKNKNTLVLINHDNCHLKSFGEIASNQIYFSINSESDIMATDIKNDSYHTDFIYHLKKPLKHKNRIISPCKLPVKTNLPGQHNIYNVLIAITIGLYYNIKPEVIQAFFNRFKGVWRRMQLIYDNDFYIIDDCAHNPGSYQAVFQTIENLPFEKLLIVNSLRGNRGTKINRANALTLSKWLKKLGNYELLTSNCNDVAKKTDKVSNDEEKIFLNTLTENNIYYLHFQELTPALNTVLKKVNKGDLILLLGPHPMDNAATMIKNLL